MLKAPLLAVALAVAAPALAQDATAAATALVDLIAPLPQAQAAMDQQLAAMRKGEAIRAMLANSPQTAQRYQMEASKNQPAFNQGLARIGAMQADAIGPIMKEMVPATRRASIEAYAKAFTAAELQAIAAFYKTPAGAKLLRTQPQVQQQVNRQISQQFAPRMQKAEQSLGPKIQAELQKLFPPQGG
ncbi:MAG: DUF2059 domain-containing protein [Sphingomonadaceae bacterium]